MDEWFPWFACRVCGVELEDRDSQRRGCCPADWRKVQRLFRRLEAMDRDALYRHGERTTVRELAEWEVWRRRG